MSKEKLQRFHRDLAVTQSLQSELRGAGRGLDDLADRAQALGYDFTSRELEAYVQDPGHRLTQAEMALALGEHQDKEGFLTDFLPDLAELFPPD